jgi:predicted nucleic acid-binding protein
LKLLDTNIVIYAFGGHHRYREPCRRLFREIAEGSAAYTIDVELLQEVLYVYLSRAQKGVAFHVFDRLMKVFPNPIPIQKEEVLTARSLLERHTGLSPRDAIHLSVALTQGLEGVVTVDKSMSRVKEVTCFDPVQLHPQ